MPTLAEVLEGINLGVDEAIIAAKENNRGNLSDLIEYKSNLVQASGGGNNDGGGSSSPSITKSDLSDLEDNLLYLVESLTNDLLKDVVEQAVTNATSPYRTVSQPFDVTLTSGNYQEILSPNASNRELLSIDFTCQRNSFLAFGPVGKTYSNFRNIRAIDKTYPSNFIISGSDSVGFLMSNQTQTNQVTGTIYYKETDYLEVD